MKPTIKTAIGNIRKQKTMNQNSKRKTNPKNKDSVRSLWNSFKCTNICIMGALQGDESKKLKTYLEKIIKENFPNLANEKDIQVQEAQRIPNKKNPKRHTPRNIIIKM